MAWRPTTTSRHAALTRSTAASRSTRWGTVPDASVAAISGSLHRDSSTMVARLLEQCFCELLRGADLRAVCCGVGCEVGRGAERGGTGVEHGRDDRLDAERRRGGEVD